MLDWLAFASSFLAVVSGFAAVWAGHGRWTYGTGDLLRGRFDALLYLGVALSTSWSMIHAAFLFQWARAQPPGAVLIGDANDARWMLLHIALAIGLCGYHMFVGRTVRSPHLVDRLQYNLWGRNEPEPR